MTCQVVYSYLLEKSAEYSNIAGLGYPAAKLVVAFVGGQSGSSLQTTPQRTRRRGDAVAYARPSRRGT